MHRRLCINYNKPPAFDTHVIRLSVPDAGHSVIDSATNLYARVDGKTLKGLMRIKSELRRSVEDQQGATRRPREEGPVLGMP
jgi:hypothetical protein